MKKVTAITLAVVLAFVIALGDQIISLSLSGNPLGIQQIKSFFGISEESTGGPIIPNLEESTSEPVYVEPETNLSYEERIQKGEYYLERGFLTYATNEFVKAANLQPKSKEPYLRLAQAFFDLMDYKKSTINAERVLEIDPNDFQAKYLLLLNSIKQTQIAEADQKIAELVSSGITDSRVFYYQALLRVVSNQHDLAQELLTTVSQTATDELKPKASSILDAYEEFAFAEAAEDFYRTELLARSFNEVEEYELAIYMLKEALKSRSDLRDAWILLGFAYLNLEKHVFALTAFESAYELDPQWPATQYFLGTTYAELERNEDAIVYLNYALNNGFEPKVVIRQRLADLYLDTQNYPLSVKIYEELLDYNKQDIEAFVRPIWIYLDFLNQPDRALSLAEAAVLQFPEDPMAYNLLGWSQIGTGNYLEAEKNLKKAISSNPNFAAAFYNLGKLYEEQDKVEVALEAYQRAYTNDSNGSIGNLAAKRYNALLVEK